MLSSQKITSIKHIEHKTLANLGDVAFQKLPFRNIKTKLHPKAHQNYAVPNTYNS